MNACNCLSAKPAAHVMLINATLFHFPTQDRQFHF